MLITIRFFSKDSSSCQGWSGTPVHPIANRGVVRQLCVLGAPSAPSELPAGTYPLFSECWWPFYCSASGLLWPKGKQLEPRAPQDFPKACIYFRAPQILLRATSPAASRQFATQLENTCAFVDEKTEVKRDDLTCLPSPIGRCQSTYPALVPTLHHSSRENLNNTSFFPSRNANLCFSTYF